MIQNTILTVILLVIIGCGAQSKSDNEATKNDLTVADASPTTVPSTVPTVVPSILPSSLPSTVTTPTSTPTLVPTVQPTSVPTPLPLVVLSPSIESNELPKAMGISFPNILNKSSNMEFIKDFNEVEKIQDMAFLNLALVSQAMPKILNECAGSITCHFQAEEFLVEYNETNITLAKIDFKQYSKKKKYTYELSISHPFNVNDINEKNDTMIYKWTNSKKDIWTIYTNKENNISVRYFNDVDANESMVIHHQKEEEHIIFMVIKKGEDYHLSSNHIKKDNENFSSNILLKNNLLISENENIIQLSLINKNAKEGNFALLSPHTRVDDLTLKNILDLTQGTFLFFNEKFQGFLYSDEFLDNINELTIVELINEEKGFKLLSEDSNESELSIN